jgi:two-component system sensor histidine kinase UhpB
VAPRGKTGWSLRFRLNLLITMLMLAFAAIVGQLIVSDMRRSLRDEMQAATKVTVQLLTTAVYGGQFLPRAGPPYQSTLDYLHTLGRVRAHEIRLTDAVTGDQVYVSPPSTWKAGRAAPGWFTDLVSPETETLTFRIPGAMLTLVPDASRAVLDAWDDVRHLIWLWLGFFILANALVFWLLGRALRPIGTVLSALGEMERGRLSVRLPAFGLPEFSAISQGFNRMGEALERSLADNRRLEQNRLVAQLIQERVEAERRELAQELHDELGQSITGVRSIAQSLANRAGEGLPAIRSGAEAIVDVAGRMYDAVHDIVRKLRPSVLDHLGLAAALQEAVRSVQARHPELDLRLALEGELEGLGESRSIAVYRMVQECLTNVLRHARARHATVRVTRAAGAMRVTVEDDGCGMAPEAAGGPQFGLLGLRERAEALGGSLDLAGAPGWGVTVKLVLPLGAP